MTLRAWKLLVCLGLLLAFAPAFAQNKVSALGGITKTYSPGAVKVSDGGDFSRLLSRNHTSADAGDFARLTQRGYTPPDVGVKTVESYGMDVGGLALEIAASRILSPAGIAAGAIAVGGAGWAGFQAGAPIAKALGHDTFTVGDTRCTATNGGWQCDDGTAPQEGDVTLACTVSGYTAEGSSPAIACMAAGDQLEAAQQSGPPMATTTTVTLEGACTGGPTAYQCPMKVTSTTTYSGPYAGYPPDVTTYYPTGTASTGEAVSTCPAVIDALNPAWSRPAGGAPDADGKCPTGRYSGKPNAHVLARVLENLPNVVADTPWPTLVPEILAKGGAIEAIAPRDLAGPASASLPGTTTTTQGPTGAPITTTTGSQNSYTYEGDKITYITNVTTTTNNDGDITTTTTTSETESDPCEKDPDRAGCAKLGDPGESKPMWIEKTVPFENEDLGFGGACPAPFQLPIATGGQTVEISYQGICDFAPMLKGLLIAMTALACLVTIIQQTTRT